MLSFHQNSGPVRGLVPLEGGGYKRKVKEGEYGRNNINSHMKMEK
jgi:hypothetical protein